MRLSRTTPPEADPAALEISRELAGRIHEAIREAGGTLSFERYMEMALYEPGLGYYRSGARRFGPGGDFSTAPEFSSLFGRTLGRQCAEVLGHIGGGSVVELGPGTGSLAAAALEEMERLGALPERWRMLEVSAPLRQEQEAHLRRAVPHLMERVEWLDALPADGEPAVWIANEVLDALPVRCFRRGAGGVEELAVAALDGGGFGWASRPADAALEGAVARIEERLGAPLPEGYASEVCTRLPAFLAGLAEALSHGVMFLIDYGYPRREYYHEQRRSGTLICHYRHRAHDDPFFLPGLQDITAWVDFTAVADAALEAGLEVLGYTSQGGFLFGAGLADLVAKEIAAASEAERMVVIQAVNRLTQPGDMGEHFKVLAVGRGYDGPISGFRMADRRGSL